MQKEEREKNEWTNGAVQRRKVDSRNTAVCECWASADDVDLWADVEPTEQLVTTAKTNAFCIYGSWSLKEQKELQNISKYHYYFTF